MSRIGKKLINIPKGVKLSLSDGSAVVEGAKGKLTLAIPLKIVVEAKDDKIFVTRQSNDRQTLANHGTIRARLANMMVGVTEGHKKRLELQGVGFRAQVQGQKITLSLGFSHPVTVEVPAEVKVKSANVNELEFESFDNVILGNIVATIRRIKPPEPYKGKGIRYAGEVVKRKQGKTVTK
ncbi:MAG: 50S ribosomal protein L6 [Candidatus Omnitrophica bacterium]|nr:50S ribosomal protein L6 [Candidatus Omnitrophota bacterium]